MDTLTNSLNDQDVPMLTITSKVFRGLQLESYLDFIEKITFTQKLHFNISYTGKARFIFLFQITVTH
jgi:hypothetical protein